MVAMASPAQISQIWISGCPASSELASAPNDGYLKPSLCMPRLTRTSAAWTCS